MSETTPVYSLALNYHSCRWAVTQWYTYMYGGDNDGGNVVVVVWLWLWFGECGVGGIVV